MKKVIGYIQVFIGIVILLANMGLNFILSSELSILKTGSSNFNYLPFLNLFIFGISIAIILQGILNVRE